MYLSMLDVVIVGAGPAGLSAALILGRCRRGVLVCDTGRHRNAASHALHGFLTRDNMAPAAFLHIGREQLKSYANVILREAEVIDAICLGHGFQVSLSDGTDITCHKLLLATGVVDSLPPIEGVERFYGRSVHHCPYCDGWEWRDQPLAVYGQGTKGAGLALMLTLWSQDVVLCTDGPANLPGEDGERLTQRGIVVHEAPIARLDGTPDGLLERLVFADETMLARRALFSTQANISAPRCP
jgi:thioredoxin reductase